jgi:RNA polymerase-binding transcription factor DksA
MLFFRLKESEVSSRQDQRDRFSGPESPLAPLTPEFLRKQQALLEASLKDCQYKIKQLLAEFNKDNVGREVRGDYLDRALNERERSRRAGEIDHYRNLIKQYQQALSLIQIALKGERRNGEEYGKCLECEGPIALNRLKAIPWALLCAPCQQKQERIK